MHAERLTNPARPGYRAEVRRIPASALLLVLSGSAGCSRGDAIARPTTVLATYVDAIAEHEYRAAYALLSDIIAIHERHHASPGAPAHRVLQEALRD